MATECTQEAILDFLKERGGKVRNADLIEHFKAVFPEEPEQKAAVRKSFKNYVDNVAYVKTESGVKHVCLKKKFRGAEKETSGTGSEQARVLDGEGPGKRCPGDSRQVGGSDVAQAQAAGDEAQHPPGSGYGNDSQVRVPHAFSPAPIVQRAPNNESKCHEFVCVVEEVDSRSGEMGNRQSFRREKRESKKERAGNQPDIPVIAVIEASPLPEERSVFTMPEPVQTGRTGQVAAAGLTSRDRQVETESYQREEVDGAIRRRDSKGSQEQEADDVEDDGLLDVCSLSGSEGNCSPKGSRKHFIEVMMSSSPQVRRSMVLRNSVYLPSKSDSDSISLVSCSLDDDRTSVALDPLEHQWMMCASDGEWDSLYPLLATEPSLILRKDFVTGFTCLHWAAKHGNPELIAQMINFAMQHKVPISVDVRSNTGYTPLHIAAMHNHMEVVKLLVGAYNADVEMRDYSGRKACQYLTDNVSVDIRDIIGAYERSDSENAHCSNGGRWRFSKGFQANLKPLRLLSPNDCDSVDGEGKPRQKVVRRKSSLSRMKPKLQKVRLRTSQIVHSVSFRDTEELELSLKGSFKRRPKTHFFG